jgi:oligopeptide transport system substrate-binding protein
MTLGILAACSAVLLTACGERGIDFGSRQGARPQPVALVLDENGRPDPAVLAADQVVYRGNGDEPSTLDPHRALGVPAAHILRDLFEGLTTESPDGKVIPGTALRWNISRDARTYTFYLRRDLVWSNGDVLDANDFVYSLRRAADPRTASAGANALLPIQNAREVLSGELPVEDLGISLLDEFTLQITLTGPTPYFLSLLASPVAFPVHRATVEQYGDQFARPGRLVSNGAFTLADWKPRVAIELRRNPRFREADQVLLERVVYTTTEDLAAEVKQFRLGEIDWTHEVPNNQFGWLQKNYPDELQVSPWMGSYFFGYNLTQEPFIGNPALRLALIMAIDRSIITDKVTQFGEKPSFSLVPPGIDGYVPFAPHYADWTQEERNHEARRLFEQAGYDAERPLHVEIRYNTSDNNKKIALAVASMWKQVLGVTSTLVSEEFRVFLQNREQKVITEVFRAGWISDYNDPYSFLEMFRTGHPRNDFGYSNESFDALLDEVGTERVRARRERLMFEAERVLMADSVIIPVYSYVTKRLVNPHLRGWEPNVMDHHLSRYMFKLRSRSTAARTPPPPVEPAPQATTGLIPLEELPDAATGAAPPETAPEAPAETAPETTLESEAASIAPVEPQPAQATDGGPEAEPGPDEENDG